MRTAAASLVDAASLEATLDRIFAKRLRPLRADANAARRDFQQQVDLRVEAEARAARLEEEARHLRLRLQQLEQDLASAQRRRAGWFRRSRVATQEA